MKALWASILYVTVVGGLVGCGKSAVEAEYCALRKEVTELTATAAAGLVNGTVSPSSANEMMSKVNEKLPRLEELGKSLPRDFNYKDRCL